MEQHFCAHRFERGISQNLFVVEFNMVNKQKIKFKVHNGKMGPAFAMYDILFEGDSVACTCMDYKTRRMLCKHIYFIIGRIGQMTLPKIRQLFLHKNTKKGLQKILGVVNEKLTAIVHQWLKGDDTGTCCICLETNKKEDHCIKCLQCENVFHNTCIFSWLGQEGITTANCPLCRASMERMTLMNPSATTTLLN